MYIRFTQPPQHLWQWFEPFLDDEEEVDPKAGGGQPITIGQMSRHMLTKLDWFSTLFPRVPVPIQKDIESKLKKRDAKVEEQMRAERGIEDGEVEDEEEDDNRERRSGARFKHDRRRSNSRERRRSRDKKRSRSLEKRSHSRDDKSSRSDDKHRYRRSRSPHSPHSHRYSRGDNREREHHRHRHRY
jgi:pre-mRNA-splicing factor 38B